MSSVSVLVRHAHNVAVPVVAVLEAGDDVAVGLHVPQFGQLVRLVVVPVNSGARRKYGLNKITFSVVIVRRDVAVVFGVY